MLSLFLFRYFFIFYNPIAIFFKLHNNCYLTIYYYKKTNDSNINHVMLCVSFHAWNNNFNILLQCWETRSNFVLLSVFVRSFGKSFACKLTNSLSMRYLTEIIIILLQREYKRTLFWHQSSLIQLIFTINKYYQR